MSEDTEPKGPMPVAPKAAKHSREVWIGSSTEAFGKRPEVVAAALQNLEGDTFTRQEVARAIESFLSSPAV